MSENRNAQEKIYSRMYNVRNNREKMKGFPFTNKNNKIKYLDSNIFTQVS